MLERVGVEENDVEPGLADELLPSGNMPRLLLRWYRRELMKVHCSFHQVTKIGRMRRILQRRR